MRSHREDGFTLIELLIVIVVLGILAAVVVFNLGSVQASAAVASCQADVKSVETAVAAYNAQTGGTPGVTLSALTTGSPKFLTSVPSTQYYAITIVNGVVMVAAPSTATPVVATATNACSGAGSSATATTTTLSPTTTLPPTTTTTQVSNGVGVVPTSSISPYFGQENLILSQATGAVVHATIVVNQNTGATISGAYDTFGNGFSDTSSASGGFITYNFVGTITPYASNGQLSAQFAGNGTTHLSSSDTWTITTTVGGVSTTLSGTF